MKDQKKESWSKWLIHGYFWITAVNGLLWISGIFSTGTELYLGCQLHWDAMFLGLLAANGIGLTNSWASVAALPFVLALIASLIGLLGCYISFAVSGAQKGMRRLILLDGAVSTVTAVGCWVVDGSSMLLIWMILGNMLDLALWGLLWREAHTGRHYEARRK